MKKLLLPAILLALSLHQIFAQKTTDPRLAGLDTMINRVLNEWHAAGCGVAVVEKDKVLFAGGFGFRDYETKKPATGNTIFQIGSSSKAFTSALLGLLEDAGELDFDEKVTTYLPELELYNDELNNHLTVRDLTCHRSGLPRHDMAWYVNPTTRDSFVYRMRFLEPSAGLRERWQYNNYGFLLQGVIAEKLSGKSWEDNIRAHFFKPLGMKTAMFDIWNAPASADVAKGYYEKDGAIRPMDYYRIEGMGPAGSICASASEMANWLLTWVNGGVFKGDTVLPAGYVRQATSAQMSMGGGAPSPENPNIYFSSYGMGWMLSSYYGHYRVEHGGNINGFLSSLLYLPKEEITVAILTNCDCNPPGGTAAELAALAAGHPLVLEEIDVPAGKLAEYEGVFENRLKQRRSITVENGILTSNREGGRTTQLSPIGKDKFRIKGALINVTFLRDEKSGQVNAVSLNTRAELDDRWIKTVADIPEPPKEVRLNEAQLDRLVGEYQLAPTFSITVSREGTQLYGQGTGQPRFEMYPNSEFKFFLKVVDAKIEFFPDADGAVGKMVLFQNGQELPGRRK